MTSNYSWLFAYSDIANSKLAISLYACELIRIKVNIPLGIWLSQRWNPAETLPYRPQTEHRRCLYRPNSLSEIPVWAPAKKIRRARIANDQKRPERQARIQGEGSGGPGGTPPAKCCYPAPRWPEAENFNNAILVATCMANRNWSITHWSLRTSTVSSRDLRSFEIRFDFESNFRFGIRFVVMNRFEIFESSASSIILCKETIGGG